MTAIVLVVLFALLLAWAVARYHLSGHDLSAYDRPTGEIFPSCPSPDEHRAVVASLATVFETLKRAPRSQHTQILRRYMDDGFPVADEAVTFVPVDAGGTRAEWALAPGADAGRRTLYIHGGAFIAGSPKSHRRLTAKFSEMTGGAVLAIDYRLMPEHRRIDGIEDCRAAYRWLLDNGPDGPAPASKVWVAGDSAGGNLTLSLIAWARDAGLRAPDAAVALSPPTDATLTSPSLRANVSSDPLLGPLFGRLTRIPNTFLLWLGWAQTRINPRDPIVSPIFDDLSRLPPVLIQASEAEMLRDDARRYVNRAIEAGSPVRLQTWGGMVHVWQIYHPQLAEGRAALDEISKFLATT